MEYENGYFDDNLEVELEDSTPTELQSEFDVNDDLFAESDVNKESVLDELLKIKGIEKGVVKILDEENVESEVNFSDLTLEEQLEILNNSDDALPEEYDLDEYEISLINNIRESGDSVEEYLEKYKQSIINELSEQSGKSYGVDDYDDQELYLLDLKQKYDLTDEELTKELDKELEDEVLFKKKVDVLRAEYKELEDQYNLSQEQQALQEAEEQYEQYSNTMVDIAIANNEIVGEFELEDDDKNEILSFLLDRDENGTTEFYRTLNDPKKMYETAWFLRYGKESIEALVNYYESEISKLKKPDKKTPVFHKKNEEVEYSINDILNF